MKLLIVLVIMLAGCSGGSHEPIRYQPSLAFNAFINLDGLPQ